MTFTLREVCDALGYQNASPILRSDIQWREGKIFVPPGLKLCKRADSLVGYVYA